MVDKIWLHQKSKKKLSLGKDLMAHTHLKTTRFYSFVAGAYRYHSLTGLYQTPCMAAASVESRIE
jgi:hypothetical protein